MNDTHAPDHSYTFGILFAALVYVAILLAVGVEGCRQSPVPQATPAAVQTP